MKPEWIAFEIQLTELEETIEEIIAALDEMEQRLQKVLEQIERGRTDGS